MILRTLYLIFLAINRAGGGTVALLPPLIQFEEAHMQDIMNLHASWEFELISTRTNPPDNTEGAKIIRS